MTISSRVQQQFFATPSSSTSAAANDTVIRIPPGSSVRERNLKYPNKYANRAKAWSEDEHERFLRALEMFPSGPWKVIATHVGSRTARQTMTHAQKYRQKIARRQRGLRPRLQHGNAPKAKTPTAVASAMPTTPDVTPRVSPSAVEIKTEEDQSSSYDNENKADEAARTAESPRSTDEQSNVCFDGAPVSYLQPAALPLYPVMPHYDSNNLLELFQESDPIECATAPWYYGGGGVGVPVYPSHAMPHEDFQDCFEYLMQTFA